MKNEKEMAIPVSDHGMPKKKRSVIEVNKMIKIMVKNMLLIIENKIMKTF